MSLNRREDYVVDRIERRQTPAGDARAAKVAGFETDAAQEVEEGLAVLRNEADQLLFLRTRFDAYEAALCERLGPASHVALLASRAGQRGEPLKGPGKRKPDFKALVAAEAARCEE